jgi:hypothetical protein
MEDESEANHNIEMTIECDMVSLKGLLFDIPQYRNLPRRRRTMIAKSMLKMINAERERISIQYELETGVIQQLIDIVKGTWRGIDSSKKYLSGDPGIDRSLWFFSDSALHTFSIRLFNILPVLIFTKKFVVFDVHTWKCLLVRCRIEFEEREAPTPGFDRVVQDTKLFDDTFYMNKFRLGNW